MNTTIVSIVAVLSGVISAAASVSDKELKHFARQAIHEDPPRAADAIAGLRAAGQRGLDALRLFYEGARRLPEGGWSSASRYQEAVDRVARQKDADLSGLFW